MEGEINNDGTQLKDEPQHIKQGAVTLDILKTLDIPYYILDKDSEDILKILKKAKDKTIKKQSPVALVIRKGTFDKFDVNKNTKIQDYELSREEAIRCLLNLIPEKSPVVSTTGMISREVFEFRKIKT